MRIANNIEMLEIRKDNKYVCPTLIWDESHLVLIDTGYPNQIELLKQAIVEAGFEIEKLTDIILTHHDWDHLGCLTDLLEIVPTVKVWAHVEEIPYIEGQKTPTKLIDKLERYDRLTDNEKVECDKRKAVYDGLNVTVSGVLTDGEIIPFCGGIEAIHTPGHTPGHIVLFLKENKILIGGDAIRHIDGQLAGSDPEHTYNMALAQQSFDKVRDSINYRRSNFTSLWLLRESKGV
ncbi:MAG: MBL fold metallo-hydrolase [Oscillospiraceae bacterium]|nr:MBL fold metallo-hydrolase [Oscillospiraceae bacterium]